MLSIGRDAGNGEEPGELIDDLTIMRATIIANGWLGEGRGAASC